MSPLRKELLTPSASLDLQLSHKFEYMVGWDTWMRRNNPGGIQIARLYNQIMKQFPGKQSSWVWPSLLLSLLFSPFFCDCSMKSTMGKLPLNETTVDTKRIIFRPCSTIQAVDYEILWSILSPRASVNISWHMGERNPHSLRARLPPAKISCSTPLQSKRDNEARRFKQDHIEIFSY